MPDNKLALIPATSSVVTTLFMNGIVYTGVNAGLNASFEAVLGTLTSATRLAWMLIATGISTVATYTIVYTVTGLGHATFFVAKKAANGAWSLFPAAPATESTAPTEEELAAWDRIDV